MRTWTIARHLQAFRRNLHDENVQGQRAWDREVTWRIRHGAFDERTQDGCNGLWLRYAAD